MILFLFKLKKNIRFKKQGDSCIVISEIPLNIIRVNKQAAQILELCDGKRTLKQIANAIISKEDAVFNLCMYFHKKGFLEIQPVNSRKYSPSITVIIPVKDRRKEITGCLRSISLQKYPENRIETIVIDDGSGEGIEDIADKFNCRVIANRISRGQSYCRNLGARNANGEILAFLDSDCMAGENWLKELAVYFQWESIEAVGGYVDGYYHKSSLDLYERTFSPLNSGKHILYETDNTSTFYAPSCNLLIRKSVYLESGGMRDDLRIGEDVDLCWRIRKRGRNLIYVPFGIVKHRHRNSLFNTLRRRAEYGTSEAVLYDLHPEKRKRLLMPPLAAAGFIAFCAAVIFTSPFPLLLFAGCLTFEAAAKALRIGRMKPGIALRKILFSVSRTYFSFFYFISFHIVRYYFLLLLLLGLAFHQVWLLGLLMLLISSCADYSLKKPKINFMIFLFYYALEHISYQAGVFLGCVKKRRFGSYRTNFVFGKKKSADSREFLHKAVND